jgi:hypothetical protein
MLAEPLATRARTSLRSFWWKFGQRGSAALPVKFPFASTGFFPYAALILK